MFPITDCRERSAQHGESGEHVSRPCINNRAASAVAIIQFTPDNRGHRISILQAVIKLKIFSGRSARPGGSASPYSCPADEDCDPPRSPTSRICSPNLFLVVAGGPSSTVTYEGTQCKTIPRDRNIYFARLKRYYNRR